MRAAVFHGRGDVRVELMPDPAPGPGEVVLEVHAAGICGTDAHEFSHGPEMSPITQRHRVTGHLGPIVPGHEVAGRVVATGKGVSGVDQGDLVVCGAGISCGACSQCRRGRTNLCVDYATVGLQRNGGLAQFCAVPASICVAVGPYDLTQDAAALAQPMAIAVHAMRRGRLQRGEDALVVGAGGIGAFLTFAASRQGARVFVVDREPARLEIARTLGADVVIDANDGAAALEKALAAADGFPTVVYEVSGSAGALDAVLGVLPPGARLVAVGLQSRPRPIDLRSLTLTEIELIGTNAHVCAADLPEAVRLLASRDQPWSDIAPVALSLERLVPDGLQPLAEGRSERVKTLVDPWTERSRPTQM